MVVVCGPCVPAHPNYRGVQKSVAHHVIGPPGLSQFHSFVAITPTLYGNITNLWIRLFLLALNLVGVDSMPPCLNDFAVRTANSCQATINLPSSTTADIGSICSTVPNPPTPARSYQSFRLARPSIPIELR